MKSRKGKAAAKGKAFLSKKKLKGQIPIDASDSGSDVDSDSFFHDDIDDYHKEKDDQLSTDDELILHKNESSEEEEVLPITDDEEESEDDEKDITSDEEAEDDLPNPEAWGKKKSAYYSADFVDEDKGRTYREEDAEAAKAEADEAFAIQKSVFSNITADNLGANLFLEGSEASEDEEEKEEQLTSATKQEKIKFLKKSNPEMFEYIRDYKTAMIEIREQLLPLLPLACEGKLPTETCENYIKVKYHLLLHLSLNISFYMLLKSSGTKMYHHPVMQRINSLKKFLDQLKPIDEAVREDIKVIVEKLKRKEEIALNVSDGEESMKDETISESLARPTGETLVKEKIKTKKSKRKNIDTETEKEIMSLINEVKEEMKKRKITNNDESETEQNQDESMVDKDGEEYDEKRTITYQIAKNKGLGVQRKKEYRNPRVKHRIKFRKAEIRRKGQVRKVVKELKRYEGEHTGISTHVVKSRKLK